MPPPGHRDGHRDRLGRPGYFSGPGFNLKFNGHGYRHVTARRRLPLAAGRAVGSQPEPRRAGSDSLNTTRGEIFTARARGEIFKLSPRARAARARDLTRDSTCD